MLWIVAHARVIHTMVSRVSVIFTAPNDSEFVFITASLKASRPQPWQSFHCASHPIKEQKVDQHRLDLPRWCQKAQIPALLILCVPKIQSRCLSAARVPQRPGGLSRHSANN